MKIYTFGEKTAPVLLLYPQQWTEKVKEVCL